MPFFDHRNPSSKGDALHSATSPSPAVPAAPRLPRRHEKAPCCWTHSPLAIEITQVSDQPCRPANKLVIINYKNDNYLVSEIQGWRPIEFRFYIYVLFFINKMFE